MTSDGPVEHTVDDGPGGLDSALARWADRYAEKLGVRVGESYPTGWCPWYQYVTRLTERDMYENIEAIDRHELPVDMIAVDDAFQKEIGDWLQLSDRFSSLSALVDRIHASDRRAGVWIAPMFVGARSDVFRDHPDWLVRTPDGTEPLWTGHIWEQDLYALDINHRGAAAHLREVFQTWRGHGFDYFNSTSSSPRPGSAAATRTSPRSRRTRWASTSSARRLDAQGHIPSEPVPATVPTGCPGTTSRHARASRSPRNRPLPQTLRGQGDLPPGHGQLQPGPRS
ncbi:alpha-galactosidase [Streptomyces sp. NBC_01717]|uniref:alpha-galactosidase n=1 Tax=Streptomyces sp. NBC_01717 TaxID=2975918 RepID=UPI002E300407|nr:alpha-galactosidase [Streptomyces sp. NBC_01717]